MKRQKLSDSKVKSPGKREVLNMTKIQQETGDKSKKKCCN